MNGDMILRSFGFREMPADYKADPLREAIAAIRNYSGVNASQTEKGMMKHLIRSVDSEKYPEIYARLEYMFNDSYDDRWEGQTTDEYLAGRAKRDGIRIAKQRKRAEVAAVKKKVPKTKAKAASPVIVEWEDTPDALSSALRIQETKNYEAMLKMSEMVCGMMFPQ